MRNSFIFTNESRVSCDVSPIGNGRISASVRYAKDWGCRNREVWILVVIEVVFGYCTV
jgi:hypothetical protein